MRKQLLTALFALSVLLTQAQKGFPVNGVADNREGLYAFTHATIVKDPQNTLSDATLLVKDGKIIAVGTSVNIPQEAIVVDCSGKFIYPSFIDLYSDYGTPMAAPMQRGGYGGGGGYTAQINSNQKGAFGWNQAIKADVNTASLFTADESKAKSMRDIGFGTVLTHVKDGLARGTGTVVTLAAKKENFLILKERASAHYSFVKGTSTQTYPSSMMGSIAVLRQSYLDGRWYAANEDKEAMNLSIKAWNNSQSLPQIFEASDKWTALRADRIGDEFGVQYIIKGGGNEYQRIAEIAATKATFILPISFPQAMDVEDPNDARFVSLSDLKHWELAPSNPVAFEKSGIPFCLTTAELKDSKQFLTNVRKAIEFGLSETKALEALTATPAKTIGLFDKVGSLDAGKLANFIIASGPIFNEKSTILQNWVMGEKYSVKEEGWSNNKGTYTIAVNGAAGATNYTLEVKAGNAASIIGKDTVMAKLTLDGKMVKINFAPEKKSKNNIRLSGVNNGASWNGYGEDGEGRKLTWTATLVSASNAAADSTKKKDALVLGKVSYPFLPFGNETVPTAENLLIKNATVWTSDAAGKLENTDVLVKGGKIVQIGKSITDATARVIDGTGKHLTAGLIDEHSHIAAASINEGGQSVTSEVRIADNLNPDDINIYRQLSGGVTSSHILHGSANTIGGQTQLIKLRWGDNDDQLKFAGAPGFIKFALGENVKRSSSTQGNQRFPDTRMGVEQVMADAFNRAKIYDAEIKAAEDNNKKKGATQVVVRRDLELDALSEIIHSKRFITMHSYVQSEITSALRVAEKYGFVINTFTHILEGYKVADKMKAHGANASTFSDWWNYKMEVLDAIPYNATIMQKVGLNVAINSDDAEMARRLNQEAAKSIKYGDMTEIEALKLVTINPAKMLRVDDKVGSIKVGKDADLVLWNENPLSIYARPEKTIVDGTVFFDREKDAAMQTKNVAERNRIIKKMLGEKRNGGPVGPAMPSMTILLNCGDHEHSHGLLTIEGE
jgi:imidazolonepropionase-like amidohydrolase